MIMFPIRRYNFINICNYWLKHLHIYIIIILNSFLKIYYGEKYKDQEFYSKLPSEDAGKAPPQLPHKEESNSNENQTTNQLDSLPKRPALPSEDPNPINAPSNNGTSGGGGFGFPSQPSAPVAPPHPPFSN